MNQDNYASLEASKRLVIWGVRTGDGHWRPYYEMPRAKLNGGYITSLAHEPDPLP